MKKSLLNKVNTTWAAVFLISLLIGIATLLLYSKDLENSKRELVSNAQIKTNNLKLFVAKEYSAALQDIYFFSKNPAYSEYLSDETAPYITALIEKTSSTFLQIRQAYSQFGILDTLGRFKLNLNIQKDKSLGNFEISETGKTYKYFNEIKDLSRNEVFVSPINLSQNVSDNFDVQFVMPVFKFNSELKMGYIRFSYSAERIINYIQQEEEKDSIVISFISSRKDVVFRQNLGFKTLSEKLFSPNGLLLNGDDGVFKESKFGLISNEDALFYAEPLDPLNKVDSPQGQLIKSKSKYHVMVHYTPEYLWARKKEIIGDKIFLGFIRIFVSSAVLLYFLRLLRIKNKLLEEKSEALEKRNTDLENSRERMEENLQRIREFAFEKNSALSTLRQKEKDLKQAQEIAQLGYYERDLVTGVSQWSDNLPSIFGLASDYDFNTQSVENIMHKEEFEEVERAFDEAVAQVKEYKVVYKVYHKNGKVEYLQDIAKPIVEKGVVVSMKGTIQNLTERVNIENELLDAKEKAEAAVKAKSDFLATMSHEIRTPLNAVIGMSILLNETQLDQKQEDFVETIKVSGNALLAVINDILDFSKIESGEMELENEPFRLIKIVEDCLQVISVSAAQKRIKLYSKIDKNAPSIIYGDESRIRQSIINLVNNAVKFTDKGEVKIVISVLDSSKEKAKLKVSVIDTGIGIEKEKQETIFSAFQQADSSITRKFGGTGLGLAITQKLVQLMGGDLKVISKVDEGSEFYFILDLKAEWEPKNQGLKIKSLRIISDEGGEAQTAKEIFVEKGVEVKMTNYRTGNFENIEKEEIIVFCEEDRKEEFIQLGEGLAASNNRIHFVCDIQKDMVECKSFRLVNRPFKISWVDKLLFGSKVQEIGKLEVVGREKELNKDLKILVAEDNPINQKLIRLLFVNLGYQIDLAEDGVMAVKAAQNTKYDLVFMDIQMPHMGGVEATGFIKTDHGENAPPIIALTANALDGDKEKYLNEGLDDYLSKPINLAELKAKILQWQKSRVQNEAGEGN